MANWNNLIPTKFETTALVKAIRSFLGGRNFKPNVRMVGEVSSATQPLPNVPGGPHHKVFDNYYCVRDGRREVTQPIIIADNTTKQIESAKPPAIESSSTSKLPLPGKVYHWD